MRAAFVRNQATRWSLTPLAHAGRWAFAALAAVASAGCGEDCDPQACDNDVFITFEPALDAPGTHDLSVTFDGSTAQCSVRVTSDGPVDASCSDERVTWSTHDRVVTGFVIQEQPVDIDVTLLANGAQSGPFTYRPKYVERADCSACTYVPDQLVVPTGP